MHGIVGKVNNNVLLIQTDHAVLEMGPHGNGWKNDNLQFTKQRNTC